MQLLYFRWRRVGTISKIRYFPGTPCQPILLNEIEGDMGTLTAPQTETIKLNIRQLSIPNNEMQITLKANKPDRRHTGDSVPQILSDNILAEGTGFQFEFHQGSFDDLNIGIENFVAPLQHRPEHLVEGPIAWYEDSWQWLKIGTEIIYANVQPRIRYVYTTVDRKTSPPQWTFQSFEKIHLGIPSNRKVKLYDAVYVR